jgi:hypothetical protein
VAGVIALAATKCWMCWLGASGHDETACALKRTRCSTAPIF